MAKLTLQLLDIFFDIHRFTPETPVPEQVFSAKVFFIGKTLDELSIVVPQEIKLDSSEVEENWRALQVLGPLDFSLTGILSNIAVVLAEQKISIFAISTFDTDYILVKKETVDACIATLTANDYRVLSK